MKILYLVSSPDFNLSMKGGAGTHMRGTIKGLKENGHEVFPLIVGDQIKVNSKSRNSLVNKRRTVRERLKEVLPSKARLILRDARYFYQSQFFVKKFLSKVKDFDPDIIYERSCLFSITGIQIAKKIGKPLYLETSGCLPEIFKDTYGISSLRLANRIEKWKLEQANAVVTEAESAKEFVSRKFELKNKEIIAKPLGVEFPKQHLKDKKPKFLTIGYVGTFASYHKVDLLLPVFEYFKNSEIRFVLIGAGGNCSLIQQEIKSRNIQNVEFPGYLNKSELLKYYSKMDIGIVPNCETHMAPIKTFEYGVNGICPMVPDYHAFKKLIKEGSTGILFSPNSSESITKRIEHILSEKEDITLYAQNWNQYVKNNFQWHNVVKEVLDHAEKNKI